MENCIILRHVVRQDELGHWDGAVRRTDLHERDGDDGVLRAARDLDAAEGVVRRHGGGGGCDGAKNCERKNCLRVHFSVPLEITCG